MIKNLFWSNTTPGIPVLSTAGEVEGELSAYHRAPLSLHSSTDLGDETQPRRLYHRTARREYHVPNFDVQFPFVVGTLVTVILSSI